MKINMNLEKIISDMGMTKVAMGRRLFPGNKYPERALARIIRGEAELSTSQIVTLSEISGLSVGAILNAEYNMMYNVPEGYNMDAGDGFYAEITNRTAHIYYRDTLISHISYSDLRNVSVVDLIKAINKAKSEYIEVM